jgi:putative FmdB family regulatory protein
MPLYEYACQECGHQFEELVRDGERVECPACHAEKLERLLSVPARGRVAPEGLPVRSCGEGPPCGRTGCGRL